MVEREKGAKLLTIRTDNAMEFKAQKPWAAKQGIQFEFTEPDTPQQNAVAERLTPPRKDARDHDTGEHP
jgi:transposase InsO family protein